MGCFSPVHGTFHWRQGKQCSLRLRTPGGSKVDIQKNLCVCEFLNVTHLSGTSALSSMSSMNCEAARSRRVASTIVVTI